MEFTIRQAVWVQDGARWFRGAVEGALGGPLHDPGTLYVVRWWNGGCFGLKYGIRKSSQLLPVVEISLGGQFGVV